MSVFAQPALLQSRSVGDLPIHIGDGNYSSKYPKSTDFLPSGVPFITASDLVNGKIRADNFRFIALEQHNKLKKGHLKFGDVLIVTRGNGVGGVVFVDQEFEGCNINAQLVLLRADESELHCRFLYYLLSSPAYQIMLKTFGTGSAQPQIPIWSLKSVELEYPSYSEQNAIAHILGTLDDKIELNRRMNATLEAMARALFQSWFVDFDPVRAKLDGCQPPGLDSATAALFPAKFQDSPLGLIPQGWRVGSIYDIADVIYGAPFASKLFNSNREGKPLIRIRDLANESPGVWTPEVHPKGYTVRSGDIIVGMDGEFRAYLWGGSEAWLNQRVCVFAPKPNFSAAFVRNSIFDLLAQVEATETATTVIHIGKNDIDRFMVIIPDAPMAEGFKLLCQPWYDQMVANKQQSRTLATMRDALLPKLLSGEIRVSAWEAQAGMPMSDKLVKGA